MKFIGHPLVGNVSASRSREEFCRRHNLDPQRGFLTILPGSRSAELRQHLPVLREAIQLIARVLSVDIVIAAAPGSNAELLRQIAPPENSLPPEISVRIVIGQTYDALAAGHAAVVSSGTATVEAALLDVPMIVIYRVTPLTALLAKPLVRTPFFSMVNLIAGKRAVPELIQNDFTPDRVAGEALRLLRDAPARTAIRADLAEVRRRLGPPGAVDRAADAILSLLRPSP